MLVPEEALDRQVDRPGAAPPAGPSDSPGAGPPRLTELAAAIDAMVGLLRGQIERAEAQAETAETRITGLEAGLRAKDAELVEAGKRTDAALALANRLGAQLADASIRAEGEMSTLRDALDGMRTTLSRTEDRAARAEERAARADALVTNLEADLRMKDAAITDAEDRSNRAHARAQIAQDRADELDRADDARKARGRWARFRAAWRGE